MNKGTEAPTIQLNKGREEKWGDLERRRGLRKRGKNLAAQALELTHIV